MKKASSKKIRIDANLQPNHKSNAEFENTSINGFSSPEQENILKNDVESSMTSKQNNENSLDDLAKLDDTVFLLPPPRNGGSIVLHSNDVSGDPKPLVSFLAY